MRLAGKVAIVVGAGQQAGETIGNGRATAIRFAQEGAKVLCVDIDEESAEETVAMIAEVGGTGSAFQADVTREAQCKALVEACVDRYGQLDILHNNVGRSRGDRPTPDMDADVWDELMVMNLKAMFMTCKHALPVMRARQSGSIINVSSTSAFAARPSITYKTSKGAVNTMTQHIAVENASYGIRANVVLPGLMDTPMAINRRAQERGVDAGVIRKEREAQVPLQNRMGTGWDVANAALFLASDEAAYVTGVILPVDGGLLCKRG